MKKLELKNDDFLGYVKNLRHACRGILVKDGKVLLGYESKNNKYIIPGGGVENEETLEECCERKLLEETGKLHLTEAEAKAGCVCVWKTLEEALEIFGRYEDFHKTNIADYGLYRREYFALKEYCDK